MHRVIYLWILNLPLSLDVPLVDTINAIGQASWEGGSAWHCTLFSNAGNVAFILSVILA